MNAEYDRAIERIKKCLALSQSANEHEAAIAMRQAAALMKKYNLEHSHVLASAVQEIQVQTRYKSRPRRWDQHLALLVARHFECTSLFQIQPQGVVWLFIGEDSRPEIAAYAYEVLSGQLQRSCDRYINETHSYKPGPQKTKFSRLYSEGWVYTLRERIGEIAENSNPSDSIVAYLEQKYPVINERTGSNAQQRQLDTDEWLAWKQGSTDGSDAVLNRGIGAETVPMLR